MNKAIWLIPLLPFAGAIANVFISALAGKRVPRILHSFIALGTVGVSALLAWAAFFHVRGAHEAIVSAGLPWISIPGFGADGGLMKVLAEHRLVVDQLSAVMILVVTNVGFLIHLYSVGYMADEKRYARYFSYLNLFTGFMLILVMASNLLLMFVGWEGVGLCSYLLIGFWFEKTENAAAGMKAFVVNRIGDFAFTVGVLLLFTHLAKVSGVWTIDFREIGRLIEQHKGALDAGILTAVGILLFGGATGKSAQLPLYVWLPDAMAGPTPVSALIHAATMVTAGVYMIARMNFVYTISPAAMTVVAAVGGLTALFAGTIGVAQNDIKKVLAYSTVSQLGFMFMGVGVGAFAAGIFHLMTHAFFKACLFLGSGSVIHGMGGEQDIRKMGGLKKYMPVTFWTFLIASLAISGVPLLAGFWSKDEILWKAWDTHLLAGAYTGKFIWLMGITAAGFTAFYMTRLVVLTFLGEPRFAPASAPHGASAGSGHGHDSHDASASAAHAATADEHDAHGSHDAGHGHGHGEHGTPHESPPSMTVPLMILAGLSVVGGFIGMGAWTHAPNWFENWLAPVFGGHGAEHHGVPFMEYVMVLVSVAVGLGGIFLGLKVYYWGKGKPAEAFANRYRELHELVRDKYRVDELYEAAAIEPLLAANEVLGRADNVLIDGAVNKTASTTASASAGTGFFDNEVVDGAVNGTARAAQSAARSARRLQTGHIRQYLTTALVGGLFVIGVFALWMYRDEFRGYLGLN